MGNYSTKKFWSLALLLVVVIFLILALVLVYLNFKDNSRVEPISVANPDNYQIPMGITVGDEGEETAAVTDDPTVDWLEFKLPAAKTTSTATSTLLSFKYPSVFKVSQKNNRLTLSSATVTSTQLHIDYQKNSLSLANYLKEVDALSATAYEGKPSIKITTSTSDVMIGDTPAVFREQKLLAADLNQYIIYFKAKDTIYSIDLVAPQLDQNLFTFFALFVNNFRIGQ